MKVRVLRLVAQPAQVMYAPLLPAALNIFGHVALLLIAMNMQSPLFMLALLSSASIGHGGIAAWGFREPHLSNLVRAWSRSQTKHPSADPDPKVNCHAG